MVPLPAGPKVVTQLLRGAVLVLQHVFCSTGAGGVDSVSASAEAGRPLPGGTSRRREPAGEMLSAKLVSSTGDFLLALTCFPLILPLAELVPG